MNILLNNAITRSIGYFLLAYIMCPMVSIPTLMLLTLPFLEGIQVGYMLVGAVLVFTFFAGASAMEPK